MFRLQFVSTRYARTQTRPSVSTPQNEKNRRKAPEKQHINTQQTTKKTSKHKKTRVIQTSLYLYPSFMAVFDTSNGGRLYSS